MDRPHRLTMRLFGRGSACCRTPAQRRKDDAIVLSTGVGVAVLMMLVVVLTSGCAGRKPAPTAQAPAAVLTAEQRQKNVESFDVVWETIKDKHYDPKLNGADWDAARAELRPKVEAATTMAEAREQMEQLISRLRQTHFGIIPQEQYTTPGDDAAGSDEASRAASQTAAKSAEPSAPSASRGRKDGSTGLTLRPWHDTATGLHRAIVTHVRPGSPADAAGVKTGWELVSVGKRQVRPVLARTAKGLPGQHTPPEVLQTMAASSFLASHVGDTLHLGFLDGADKARVVTLTSATPPGVSVTFGQLPTQHVVFEHRRLPDSNVAYLYVSIWLDPARFQQFMLDAVKQHSDASGWVIDLRGNPGGIGALATAMAGFMVEQRNVELGTMITRDSRQRFVINPRPQRYSGPVTVLIDGMSMSTSEIFAAGMRDIGRGRLFGTRTGGAALPSVLVDLPNGDRFQYAFANYISAKGDQLEGNGVPPDVEVPVTRAPYLAGHDPVLDAAVGWIQSRKSTTLSTINN